MRHGRKVEVQVASRGRQHGHNVYVDRDSIYETTQDSTVDEALPDAGPLTQFGRAMEELEVELIQAHSPQAMGRVERRRRVQDRLVKALRLRKSTRWKVPSRRHRLPACGAGCRLARIDAANLPNSRKAIRQHLRQRATPCPKMALPVLGAKRRPLALVVPPLGGMPPEGGTTSAPFTTLAPKTGRAPKLPLAGVVLFIIPESGERAGSPCEAFCWPRPCRAVILW